MKIIGNDKSLCVFSNLRAIQFKMQQQNLINEILANVRMQYRDVN